MFLSREWDMDSVDCKILSLLKKNSRINATAISEKVNLSISAVSERIKKMESSGVIKQYTLVVDSVSIGMDISAFISVSLEHPKFNNSFSESIQKHKHIVECHYITGDFDFLLKVIVSSTSALESVLNDIKRIEGVSLTRTLVVLSTIKNDFSVLPDGE